MRTITCASMWAPSARRSLSVHAVTTVSGCQYTTCSLEHPRLVAQLAMFVDGVLTTQI